MNVMNDMRGNLSNFFRSWYKCNGRYYPWRDDNVNAFGILVAELMLRKTQAAKVVNVWLGFMNVFRSPEDCLRSEEIQLLEIVSPLGLSRVRTRAIREICKIIVEVHGGKVPETVEVLLTLPHVGLYTANAVACFAYNKKVAIVDGNVIRVISRIFGEIPKEDNRRVPGIWSIAEDILPLKHYKEHNYAILDFAALVCTARNPKCKRCSLKKRCNYYKSLMNDTSVNDGSIVIN